MFLFSLTDIKRKQIALHLVFTSIALALWYFRFFVVAGIGFSEGAFLTFERAAGVLGVFILFILYVLFISKLKWLKGKIEIPLEIMKFFLASFNKNCVGHECDDISTIPIKKKNISKPKGYHRVSTNVDKMI